MRPSSDIKDFESAHPASFVFGVDEVGRGCIAGPVTAACFAFPLQVPPHLNKAPVRIFDSKQLNAEQRVAASTWLRAQEGCVWSVCEASVQEIDQINILRACWLAMERAFDACCQQLSKVHGRDTLMQANHRLRVDGNLLPERFRRLPKNFTVEALVKGDAKSFAIASAAILAKVERDGRMHTLAQDFPHYSWESNVGYPTPAHKEAVNHHGRSPWHRNSFNIGV